MKCAVCFAAILITVVSALGQTGDLATAKLQYDNAITAIHSTRVEAEKNLAGQYTNALSTLQIKAQSDGDLDKVKAILAEKTRFETEHSSPAAQPSVTELKNLADALNRRLREIGMKEAADILKQTQQYDATLAALQKDLTKQGKIDDASAVQDERKKLAETQNIKEAKAALAATAATPATSQIPPVFAEIPATAPTAASMENMFASIRKEIDKRSYKSTADDSISPEIPTNGALLVGFKINVGNWSGHTIIWGIQPVFLTADGITPGKFYGRGKPNHEAIAPPGYAVGEMKISTGSRVDGFNVTFQKIIPDSLKLTFSEPIKSDWFGGAKANDPSVKKIGGTGRPAIGVAVKSGDAVDRIGLILPK